MSFGAFSVSVVTPAAAAGATYLQIKAPAAVSSASNMAISEIGLVLNAATESGVGLIKAATNGTATTTVGGLAEGNLLTSAGNSFGKIATAWSVAPTVAGTAIYLRRVLVPAIAGASVTWSWDDRNPLILPNDSSLLLWNIGASTASVLNVYVRWWEQQRVSGQKVTYANDRISY